MGPPESPKLRGPHNTYTASFAALTGRALTIFRAGLALNISGSRSGNMNCRVGDHREVLVCVPTFGHVTDSRLEELLIDGGYLIAPMVKPATKRVTKKL
jgi:hypothetical protein